jgi:threonine/homoserine/homoserine lactone efflux protein
VTGPEILTITGAAAALAVTPGPETILTIRLSSLRRKAGLVYALGTATGTVIWMVLALTGVSALLTVYPAAVQVLKIGGGLYLCLLGILAGRQALRLRRELKATEAAGPTRHERPPHPVVRFRLPPTARSPRSPRSWNRPRGATCARSCPTAAASSPR